MSVRFPDPGAVRPVRPGGGDRGRHLTLAGRTGLVMAAVVIVAILIAAVLSINLVRSSARTEATKALRVEADTVVGLLDAGRPGSLAKAARAVRPQGIQMAWMDLDGTVRGDAVAREAYLRHPATAASDPTTSFTTRLRADEVLVEVRTLDNGDRVILAKAESLAVGPALGLLRRELLALAIGLLVALGASVLFARWLAAPLRRTAAAAVELASGDRSVRLEPAGPREVVAVSEALNTLTTALGRSERRQREFLLSVSHELRTPLTAIRGFGESLADRVTTGADVPPAGQVIVAESARLERLVTDLLDLARLGAADFRFEIVSIDLRAVIEQAAVVWRSRCTAVGVNFAVELPGFPVRLHSDQGRIRQIVDGLAENALRVTPTSGTMVIALRTSPGHAVVEVRDDGPGLTDDDLAVAFERSALYERYRGVRKVGTGLGLALVKALADGLGGSVEAARGTAGGSCFRVRFRTDQTGS